MKIFAVLLLSLAFTIVYADEYAPPAYTANEILSAILADVTLERHQIEVAVMTYDYVKKIWHVELIPGDSSCIDCFPSFFINDGEEIVVEKLPHD